MLRWCTKPALDLRGPGQNVPFQDFHRSLRFTYSKSFCCSNGFVSVRHSEFHLASSHQLLLAFFAFSGSRRTYFFYYLPSSVRGATSSVGDSRAFASRLDVLAAFSLVHLVPRPSSFVLHPAFLLLFPFHSSPSSYTFWCILAPLECRERLRPYMRYYCFFSLVVAISS